MRAIATFYRAQMKPLGWHEIPSVINRPNMTVLDFSKGGKTVSLTIMQMGNETTVRATGSGLVTAAARGRLDAVCNLFLLLPPVAFIAALLNGQWSALLN